MSQVNNLALLPLSRQTLLICSNGIQDDSLYIHSERGRKTERESEREKDKLQSPITDTLIDVTGDFSI